MIVPFQQALSVLDLLLGWSDPWFPLDHAYTGPEGVVRRSYWHHAGAPRALVDLVQRSDELRGEEIRMRVPEPQRGSGPMGATFLWARVEGADQLRRAREFRPLPSIAVQEGQSARRWLLWPLSRRLDYFYVERANKRIAYRLRAVQKHGVPENFALPLPGCVLSIERARPVPVVCRRLEPVVFTARQVVGRLKDPPEPKWMERTG